MLDPCFHIVDLCLDLGLLLEIFFCFIVSFCGWMGSNRLSNWYLRPRVLSLFVPWMPRRRDWLWISVRWWSYLHLWLVVTVRWTLRIVLMQSSRVVDILPFSLTFLIVAEEFFELPNVRPPLVVSVDWLSVSPSLISFLVEVGGISIIRSPTCEWS